MPEWTSSRSESLFPIHWRWPSIQAASQRALEAGATPKSILELVGRVRAKSDIPIVLMTYFNPVQKLGVERFAKEAASAGADGVIMTDLPPEEAAEWKRAADAAGLDTVFLLAPTSTDARIRLVAGIDTGFIYCVSRTGVTALEGKSLPRFGTCCQDQAATSKPVAVGFGVSIPEHVREICKSADGVVVGSALVDLIASGPSDGDLSRRYVLSPHRSRKRLAETGMTFSKEQFAKFMDSTLLRPTATREDVVRCCDQAKTHHSPQSWSSRSGCLSPPRSCPAAM